MPNRIITKGQIGNALESVAPDHILGVANDIFDESLQMYQSEINQTRTTGGVYDISVANAVEGEPAKYSNLSSALAAIVSDAVKAGGMTVRYIQSSDNKYVQYRLMAQTFSTTVTDWQGVDNTITPGSDNLAKSGDVYTKVLQLYKYQKLLQENSYFTIDWEDNYVAEDNYSCYLTRVIIRTSVITISNLSGLGIETTTSPISGNTSIRVPNNSSLVYDLSDNTYKVASNTDTYTNYITLFSNREGKGRKATFDGSNQIHLLRFIAANFTSEELELLKNNAYFFVRLPELERVFIETANIDTICTKGTGYLTGKDTYSGSGVYHKSTRVFSVLEGETIKYKGKGEYSALSYIFLGANGTSIVGTGKINSVNAYVDIQVPTGAYYAQFSSYNSTSADTVVLDVIPTSSIKNDVNTLKAEIVTKAEVVKTKNLYDKSDILKNYKFNYYATPVASEGSCISGKIPVEAGKTYHLHRELVGRERTICAYNSSDQVVSPLLKEDGSEWSAALTAQGNDITFKIPTGATYIRFNIDWYPDYVVGHESLFQLEEGNKFTGWEDFGYKVPYSELPKDLEKINERVEELEDVESKKHIRINVKTSDKVGFFSNSFLEGYAMYGKHAIEKLMMFSDYLPYNYSKSGDDMAEEIARLDEDQNMLGVCKPSEIGSLKYGIIMMQDNDGVVFNANHRTYYENAKHLGYSIMSLGGQPIISTEHDWAANYLTFQRLCQDEGWQFANWGKIYHDIPVGVYPPMWYNSHPATRSNWCQVHGFLPIIQSLPRPVQSVKLFRLRSSVDTTDIKNMLYNTLLERAERWAEIHNGQTGIKSGQEAKFDRTPSNYQLQNYNCEYQNLVKNISVSFGSYLLADITIPYNVRDTKGFSLTIKGTGISSLYARQIRYMDNSWLPTQTSKYIAFGITSGAENLNVGDSITISGIERQDGTDLNKTYTISAITDGYIITTELSGTHVTSGTDTPSCDISGVTLAGSYDFPSGAYMDNYNKPLGQWTEITFTDTTDGISLDLTSEQIEKFGVADKFVFMAVGTDIAITDIYADVIGTSTKNRFEKAIIIPEPKTGQSALSTTTFTAEDTEWENLSNIPIVTPVTDGTYTEQLPGTVREIPTNGWLAQQLDTTKFAVGQYKKPLRVQVQILARWFPKYIKTDSDYATSELTPDSFDMAKLEVQLNNSSNPSDNVQFPITTMYIGAWWNVYVFEMDLVGEPTWLTLKCVDKRVQVAKCDLVVIE